MIPNKKLPILKLFIYPLILVTAYGAYCYYSEQYQKKKNDEEVPIRYMEFLSNGVNSCQNTSELREGYRLMAQHVDKFVIYPRIKNYALMPNSEIQTPSQNNHSTLVKKYQINIFNITQFQKTPNQQFPFQTQDGPPTPTVTKTTHKLQQTQKIQKYLQLSIQKHKKNCKRISKNLANSFNKDYVQQYMECIKITEENVMKLRRQSDIIRKNLEFQNGGGQ